MQLLIFLTTVVTLNSFPRPVEKVALRSTSRQRTIWQPRPTQQQAAVRLQTSIVSGDEGQGSMTKMIYVPGKISAGADADAQIAGQFGGYGMPGHYLGHLTGKAAAQRRSVV